MHAACTGKMPPSADGHTAQLFEYAASRHVQAGTEAKEKQSRQTLRMENCAREETGGLLDQEIELERVEYYQSESSTSWRAVLEHCNATYGGFDRFHMSRVKVKGVAKRGSTSPASCVPAEFVKSNQDLKLGPRSTTTANTSCCKVPLHSP